jgi:hypothetical protein
MVFTLKDLTSSSHHICPTGTMNIGHPDAPASGSPNGLCACIRNIVKLEIQEYLKARVMTDLNGEWSN